MPGSNGGFRRPSGNSGLRNAIRLVVFLDDEEDGENQKEPNEPSPDPEADFFYEAKRCILLLADKAEESHSSIEKRVNEARKLGELDIAEVDSWIKQYFKAGGGFGTFPVTVKTKFSDTEKLKVRLIEVEHLASQFFKTRPHFRQGRDRELRPERDG